MANKMIDITELWDKEWKNAYAFFNSKGNTHTKSMLKTKWYKNFKRILMFVEIEVKKH